MSEDPIDPLDQLLLELIERVRSGETEALEELCRAHPEHEASFRRHAEDFSWILSALAIDQGTPELATPASMQRRALDLDPALERLEGSTRFEERYSLQSEVGRGGMGVVMRAYDRRLRRLVAAKLVRTTEDGERPRTATVGRFLSEAQITALLEHPGIIPVYDVGVDGERRPYFTMRLVRDAQTLGDIFARMHASEPEWNRERVLAILLRACEAVAYAHSRGTIHRDLKPTNIVVGRFGETYVLDWGVARVLGGEQDSKVPSAERKLTPPLEAWKRGSGSAAPAAGSGESTRLTIDGSVVGTPTYMAPEQGRGESDVDGSVDVYSIGAILYHLLAGAPPYSQAGGGGGSLAVLARLLAGPPARLTEACPSAPPELVALCEKAMAREPSERYADVPELIADLRAFLEGRVVRAYRTGLRAALGKWIGRNKALAAAILACVLLLFGGLVSAYVLEARSWRTIHAREADLAQRTYLERIAAVAGAYESGYSSRVGEILAACPPELRRWEWRYLAARLDSSTRSWSQGAPVVRVAASPVEEAFFAAGRDGSLRKWSPSEDAAVLELEADHGPITAMRLAPDGARLYVGYQDGSLRMYDAFTGTLLVERTDQRFGITDICIARNLPCFLCAAADRTIYAYSTVTGAPVDHYSGDRTVGSRVRFAVDPLSRFFATWGGEANVQLWNLPRPGASPLELALYGRKLAAERQAGLQPRRMPGVDFDLNEIEVSPDGAYLAGVGAGGPLLLWRVGMLDDGFPAERLWPSLLAGAGGGHSALAFAPGSDLLATARHAAVALVETTAGRLVGALHGHQDAVSDLEFFPDGERIVSGDRAGGLRLWEHVRSQGPAIAVQVPVMDEIRYVAVDAAGRRAAWLSHMGQVVLWDSERRVARTLATGQGWMGGIGFLDGGRVLVTIDSTSVMKLWDLERGDALIQSERGAYQSWYAMTTSEARDAILRPTATGGVEVVGRDGTAVRAWSTPGKTVAIAFEEQSAAVAWGTSQGSVHLAHIGGEAISTLPIRIAGRVRCLAFSPDGELLLVGGEDHWAHLLRSVDLGLLRSWKAHEGGVSAARFLGPDRLVTAGEDCRWTIWQVPSGERVLDLPGDGHALACVGCLADGTLLSGGAGRQPLSLSLER